MTREDPGDQPLALSFRDPSGQLCRVNNRILRLVSPAAVEELRTALGCQAVQSAIGRGRVVGSRFLDGSAIDDLRRDPRTQRLFETTEVGAVVEHDVIPFASYPHEWPAEMLAASARLTIDLAADLVAHDLGLKDATPLNVLFRGPEPVFVDVLSFERRTPGDATWLPYAQFVRTFLLPLLVNRRFGIPLDQVFLTRRDGIEPEEARRLFGPIDRLLPPVVTLVSLPAGLSARAERSEHTYERPTLQDPERARFVLERILSSLKGTLRRVEPQPRESEWSGYLSQQTHYSEDGLTAKSQFVEACLETCRPARVLDAGCNTGQFSELAARSGASVVALDADPVVVGSVWRRATTGHLDILPLVVNLARPSPAVGWRNLESDSFLGRAAGAFDLVLMLALFHHLFVTERVPLGEIVALAASLTRRALLIEYVGPDDPMFRRLMRGRDPLFTGLTREQFERALSARFEIARSVQLPHSERWLYLLTKRQRPDA